MNPLFRETAAVREIAPDETALAFPAIRTLRTDVASRETFVRRVNDDLRPGGYRLVGAFLEDNADAVSVAGFRPVRNLAWGDYLFVDDLSTLPTARRGGHAGALLQWLVAEAERLQLCQLHLDSALGPERTDAHRLYFKNGFRIVAHHFAMDRIFPPR